MRASTELAARTLQIAPEAWTATVDAARAALVPARDVDAEIARGVAALASAFAPRNPHAAAAPADAAPVPCVACGAWAVRPWRARRPAIVYGRCERCGHAALFDADEASLQARYADADYYRARTADNVGYDAYEREAAYREAKGARLVEKLGAAGALLEVGSGFGYTRAAAARAGWRTAGVDLNPHAVAEAARRYGLATFQGTLAGALAAPTSGVARGAFDVVLYQFVLEHVTDPAAELALAREALAPGGRVALLVPSAEAAEIDAFGAAYRSFRADHLHLFTRASLSVLCDRAGFAAPAVESGCNLHLLGDVLSPTALTHLYATGRGPDLFVLAERSP
jgi:SAM-dependent methyltransferase